MACVIIHQISWQRTQQAVVVAKTGECLVFLCSLNLSLDEVNTLASLVTAPPEGDHVRVVFPPPEKQVAPRIAWARWLNESPRR